jgi:hypothetical protein
LLDSNIGTWSTKFPPQIENAVRAQLLPDEVDAKLLLKIFQKRKKKLQHVDMNLPAWLTVEELPVAREILKRYKITFNSTIY